MLWLFLSSDNASDSSDDCSCGSSCAMSTKLFSLESDVFDTRYCILAAPAFVFFGELDLFVANVLPFIGVIGFVFFGDFFFPFLTNGSFALVCFSGVIFLGLVRDSVFYGVILDRYDALVDIFLIGIERRRSFSKLPLDTGDASSYFLLILPCSSQIKRYPDRCWEGCVITQVCEE